MSTRHGTDTVPADIFRGIKPGDWVETPDTVTRQVATIRGNLIRFTNGTAITRVQGAA